MDNIKDWKPNHTESIQGKYNIQKKEGIATENKIEKRKIEFPNSKQKKKTNKNKKQTKINSSNNEK